MSRNATSPRSLTVKYLIVFAAIGLFAAALLVLTVSVVAATIVFVACLETGAIFAGLSVHERKRAVVEAPVRRTADAGSRSPRELPESNA